MQLGCHKAADRQYQQPLLKRRMFLERPLSLSQLENECPL